MPDADSSGTQPDQFFRSNYLQETYNTDFNEFRGAQFHFHAKSEHTINGKRYDLEMHTVHLPAAASSGRRLAEGSNPDGPFPVFASAMGIMFDRDDYDPTVTVEERRIIDSFFDSLGFTTEPPENDSTVENYKDGQSLDDSGNIIIAENANVPYGDLNGIVDHANRWSYMGSLTTAPCTQGVYFNVVDRVLPISQRHFDAYVAHQSKYMNKVFFGPDGTVWSTDNATGEVAEMRGAQQTLDVTGNWRVTQIIDKHNV